MFTLLSARSLSDSNFPEAAQAGEGSLKQSPVAFIYQRKPGQMQTRPYKVFYKRGEAEAYLKGLDGQASKFYIVTWEGRK